MKKAERERLKLLAQNLYMNTDMHQKEIAAFVEVSEKTISEWASEGKWREMKQAEKGSKAAVIRNLYKKLFEETEKDNSDSDKVVKWASSIEKLDDKKVTIPTIISVFKQFTTFLMGRDMEAAKRFNKLQSEFLREHVNGF